MASMLWKTSFILRAITPLSLVHDFLHIRLLAHQEDDNDDDHLQLNISSISINHNHLLQSLCLSLSRAAAPSESSTMQAPLFVAFPNSLTSISVVFPAGRKMEMKHALQHFLKNFSKIRLDCTPEEELNSGLTMQNFLLCGLRAAFLCDGWIVLDGNLALQGSCKEWLDGTIVEAVAFGIRTQADDCIDFVLSPDVIRIRPFKIERLLIGFLKNQFDDGAVVSLDDYIENLLPDDMLEMKCLVLPSMQEGYVSGCSRNAPKHTTCKNYEEIWCERHGLVLPNEVFYIRVSFPSKGSTIRSWFPSCLVLKSCGLVPALPSSIHHAVEDQQSSWWTPAKSVLQTSQIELNGCNFEHKLDIPSDTIQTCFRRPKLPSSYYAVNEVPELLISNMPGENDLNSPGLSFHSESTAAAKSPTSFKVPVFSKRKLRDVGLGCTIFRNDQKLPVKIKSIQSGMRQGDCPTKEYVQGALTSIPADSGAVHCLSKKRVCAGSERSLCNKLQKLVCKSAEKTDQTLLQERAPVGCGPSILKSQKPLTSSGVVPHARSKQSHCVKESSKDQKGSKVSTARGKKTAGGEKKSTTTSIDQEANKHKVYSKHAQGKLSDLTVPELKLFLSEHKTKVSGKKEELIQRIVLLLSSKET